MKFSNLLQGGARASTFADEVESVRYPGRLIGVLPRTADAWQSTSIPSLRIRTLPGPNGRRISQPLTHQELAGLSGHFEGVEFGISTRTINGREIHLLESGRAGQLGRIETSWVDVGNVRMGPHTHPDMNANVVSISDRDLLISLRAAQEREGFAVQEFAEIVLPDGSVFTFNVQYRNIEQKIPWPD